MFIPFHAMGYLGVSVYYDFIRWIIRVSDVINYLTGEGDFKYIVQDWRSSRFTLI